MWASMVVPGANLPQCRGEFVSVRDRFPCQFPPHRADESFHPAILPRTSRLDSHDRGWPARDATGPANPSSPGDRHPISDCVASTTAHDPSAFSGLQGSNIPPPIEVMHNCPSAHACGMSALSRMISCWTHLGLSGTKTWRGGIGR